MIVRARTARLSAVVAAGIVVGSVSSAAQDPVSSSRTVTAPLPHSQGGDPRRIALGRDLFLDRRLSGSMRLRCASCHDLTRNGATSARLDRSDSGHVMRFNTPTLFNSAYNFRMGWEGRTRTLPEMARWTLGAGHLMGGTGRAVPRLAADRHMAARFHAAYGTGPDIENVADALAAFMATLVTPDAPFDRWLLGNSAALTPQQIRGFARFKSLGCASCHQGVNLGGNLFQRRGIFYPLGEPNPRYLRVPSLRNVGVTAPYFHDGSVESLPVAIRQMAHAQLGLTIGSRDARDISAFLDALTGTYRGRRLTQAEPSVRR